MSRQDANAAFALSSFLQGTNATYIDEIYARYENDPASVDAEWQEFFKSLKDTPADVRKNAEGPSWGRNNWPLTPNDELTSALDGNWIEVVFGSAINMSSTSMNSVPLTGSPPMPTAVVWPRPSFVVWNTAS